MSEDTNITALGEEVKKVKNEINHHKTIVKFLAYGFPVYIVFFIVFLLIAMAGGNSVEMFLTLLIGFVVPMLIIPSYVMWLKREFPKLEKQEAELKKRIMTLLYPLPNCHHCGKPLVEGNKFCTYCGNTRHP